MLPPLCCWLAVLAVVIGVRSGAIWATVCSSLVYRGWWSVGCQLTPLGAIIMFPPWKSRWQLPSAKAMPALCRSKSGRWRYFGCTRVGICLPVIGIILPLAAINTTVGSPLIGAQLLGIRESVHESRHQAGTCRLQ
ncbi:hypothetical protein D3C75_1025750 [compost metagenome]